MRSTARHIELYFEPIATHVSFSPRLKCVVVGVDSITSILIRIGCCFSLSLALSMCFALSPFHLICYSSLLIIQLLFIVIIHVRSIRSPSLPFSSDIRPPDRPHAAAPVAEHPLPPRLIHTYNASSLARFVFFPLVVNFLFDFSTLRSPDNLLTVLARARPVHSLVCVCMCVSVRPYVIVRVRACPHNNISQ